MRVGQRRKAGQSRKVGERRKVGQRRKKVAGAACPRRPVAALVLAAGLCLGGLPAAATVLPAADSGKLPADLPAVLPVVGSRGAAAGADLSATAVGETLRAGLGTGGRISYRAVDVFSGERLAEGRGTRGVAPASTMKLVTALAALTALGPDARLRTEARLANPVASVPTAVASVPTVVVVGAGDPSLTTRRVAGPAAQRPASLQELAERTARALALRGTSRVQVGYDAGLFAGPAVAATWSPAFPAQGIVAPVSALVADQGKPVPSAEARTQDPAALAARRFAERLQAIGVVVVGAPRPMSAPAAARLGWVDSPSVGDLVEHMLTTSDNDYAEALARLAALAAGESGSFRGVQEHNREVLRTALAGQGVSLSHVRLLDGSGLSRGNRLTAAALTGVLVSAASGWESSPGGRLSPLFSGLPVAGATGSLHNRFSGSSERRARGSVRAKTGTLSGIASLAGYAQRADGRLVAFAFLNDHAASTLSARRALDDAAAQLVVCKCTDAG